MEPTARPQKKMGRPATGRRRHVCGFSLSDAEFAALDALCEGAGRKNRSATLGRLVLEAHARAAATTAPVAE